MAIDPIIARAATLLFALSATRVAAQQSVAASILPGASACVAALPDSVFTRVAVYAALAMKDPRQRIPPSVANLLQAVVGRAEMELNAKPPILAHGEPAITWRDLGGALVVIWHRAGALATTVVPSENDPERLRPAGVHLLARGLAAADSAGEAMMLWPDDFTGDSTSFAITLESQGVDSAGKVHPIEARLAVPAFSVAAPRETPVRIIKPPRKPVYPRHLVNGGVEGRVMLDFVVDTTGLPDTTTIKEDWPADKPRLDGKFALYYDEFLRSARSGVSRARFAPAKIGGCPVRQTVQQPFEWQIR